MGNRVEGSTLNPGFSDLSCRKSHHPKSVKTDLVSRLNRIEGQIRGIKGP